MQPSHVTFTGFDAWTSHHEMLAMSRDFPIEWGILMHPERQGEGRNPPISAIEAVLTLDLSFSAHLCGSYARCVVRGAKLPNEIQSLLGQFRRIQVNTAERGVDPIRIAAFAAQFSSRGILQCRGTERFPGDTNVDWLFDRSGGRGLLPTRWPMPGAPDAFVGYAGGLGPDTVAEALAAIARQHSATIPFWIDMEGAIRTEDRLDLEKCRHVCRTLYSVTIG